MIALFKKELSSFLTSLIGYIVIAIFLIINGLFLWVFPMEFNIMDYGYAKLDGLFLLAPFVFLFLIPAITMRSFADEKKAGTIELLVTKPITDLQIIMAKYLAGVVLVLFSLIPTAMYYITVFKLGLPQGNIDSGGTLGSYIGLFSSSLTDNQIVSFVIAVFMSGFFYLGFEFIYSLDIFGSFDLFIKTLGITDHYMSMSRGVIDTRDIIYFLSLITLFILFTKISIQSRKW